MKKCVGCRYLIPRFSLCKVQSKWEYVTNPYTGVEVYENTGPFPPEVDKMRAPGAACGPDAVLYTPTWRRLVWVKLFGGDA